MKFGIFYELQLPRPWTENAEYELFTNALNQIELADKLGYDYAWEVEHHSGVNCASLKKAMLIRSSCSTRQAKPPIKISWTASNSSPMR